MLARVVAEERPDLEEMKNTLIIANATMRNELKALEDTILEKLSTSENPVDDIELITALEASKAKSTEIKVCVKFFYLIKNVNIIYKLDKNASS
jgi:dynein heavy chain